MNEGDSLLAGPSEGTESALSANAADPGTFRLPSTTLFLGLMPVFSGLARRADLAAVLSDQQERPDADGNLRSARVRTYIVYSGRQSEARTSVSLFDDDPLWNEGELSMLIKRQFGPAGLKHLLGILIAAEEQGSAAGGQPGGFIFDANRHLDILGYSRANRVLGKGYHTAKHLKEAREIVTLLCSLTIVQERRFGARRGATLKVKLLQDEAAAESWEETVADGERMKERITTNEKVFLRFNPHLFNAAAAGSRRTKYLYTLQLKKLARENARTHGLTLTLGVHLPIKFRLNGGKPLELSARSFLRMAGLTEDEYTCYEHLERIENSLRHMVEQGYISSFETERYRYRAAPILARESGEQPIPANKSGPARRVQRAHLELKAGAPTAPPEPLEEMWQVAPPEFLREILGSASHAAEFVQSELNELARQTPKALRPPPQLPGMESGGHPPGAAELLRHVRRELGLQQAELARRLGVTQAAVSMAEAGKRPRMAERLLEKARRLPPGEAH
jgi:hypothetical protein